MHVNPLSQGVLESHLWLGPTKQAYAIPSSKATTNAIRAQRSIILLALLPLFVFRLHQLFVVWIRSI
jgi:hypothetical protein